MNQELQKLKLKKARLIDQLESLTNVSESLYAEFGKTEAQIIAIEKQITRETQNIIN